MGIASRTQSRTLYIDPLIHACIPSLLRLVSLVPCQLPGIACQIFTHTQLPTSESQTGAHMLFLLPGMPASPSVQITSSVIPG